MGIAIDVLVDVAGCIYLLPKNKVHEPEPAITGWMIRYTCKQRKTDHVKGN